MTQEDIAYQTKAGLLYDLEGCTGNARVRSIYERLIETDVSTFPDPETTVPVEEEDYR